MKAWRQVVGFCGSAAACPPMLLPIRTLGVPAEQAAATAKAWAFNLTLDGYLIPNQTGRLCQSGLHG